MPTLPFVLTVTSFWRSCWFQLVQENSRTLNGSEKPGRLWFWGKKKNSEESHSPLHFPVKVISSCLASILVLSFLSPGYRISAPPGSCSHSPLCYLPNYQLRCGVSVIFQGRRKGSERFFPLYIKHLNIPIPHPDLHQAKLYPFFALFRNSNCLWRLPWSCLTISIAPYCNNCVIKLFWCLLSELQTFWKLRTCLIYIHNPKTKHNAKKIMHLFLLRISKQLSSFSHL